MPSNYIYVFEDDAYDYSRWLTLGLRSDRIVTIHLSDLCHPGRVSSLGQVPCALEHLEALPREGLLQITMSRGYLLVKRDSALVALEFKSHDDVAACRTTVKTEEFDLRIVKLVEEASAQKA